MWRFLLLLLLLALNGKWLTYGSVLSSSSILCRMVGDQSTFAAQQSIYDSDDEDDNEQQPQRPATMTDFFAQKGALHAQRERPTSRVTSTTAAIDRNASWHPPSFLLHSYLFFFFFLFFFYNLFLLFPPIYSCINPCFVLLSILLFFFAL